MENASKALIIAGAILLAILIISLGILVYNQAADTVDQANLDSETLQTFNSKFTDYEGSNKSAATVRTLISLVNSSNQAEESSARGLYVVINGYNSGSTVTERINDAPTTDFNASNCGITVNDTYTYAITLEYQDGAVWNVVITQV